MALWRKNPTNHRAFQSPNRSVRTFVETVLDSGFFDTEELLDVLGLFSREFPRAFINEFLLPFFAKVISFRERRVSIFQTWIRPPRTNSIDLSAVH